MGKKWTDGPKYPGEISVAVHPSGEVHIKTPDARARTTKTIIDKNKGKTFKPQKEV